MIVIISIKVNYNDNNNNDNNNNDNNNDNDKNQLKNHRSQVIIIFHFAFFSARYYETLVHFLWFLLVCSLPRASRLLNCTP